MEADASCRIFDATSLADGVGNGHPRAQSLIRMRGVSSIQRASFTPGMATLMPLLLHNSFQKTGELSDFDIEFLGISYERNTASMAVDHEIRRDFNAAFSIGPAR
jgi:hypothetical protein